MDWEVNMRKILIFVLIGILLFGSQTIVGVNNTSEKTEDSNRDLEWVIMIYLNGDNALSAAQGVILEEIRQEIQNKTDELMGKEEDFSNLQSEFNVKQEEFEVLKLKFEDKSDENVQLQMKLENRLEEIDKIVFNHPKINIETKRKINFIISEGMFKMYFSFNKEICFSSILLQLENELKTI